MKDSSEGKKKVLPAGLKLKKLTLEQVKKIDEIVDSVDDYGEVHLVIQHGELRYINVVRSFKAWNHGGWPE